MGWGAIGKFFTKAAPYIAAPFTGGASLAFAPLANAGVSAWNAYDARKNAEKGLGPSRYDQILDMGGDIYGGLHNAGMFGGDRYNQPNVSDNRGGAGNRGGGYGQFGTPSYFPPSGGRQQDIWGPIAQTAGSIFSQMGQRGQQQQPQYGGGYGGGGGIGPRAMPRMNAGIMPPGGYGYNENPMNQLNQRAPNLSQSIFQGRQEAMMNQPWRDPNFDRMQGMQIYPQMGY